MDPIEAVRQPDPYPHYDALATKPGLVSTHGLWIAAHPDVVHEVLESDACAVRPAGEPVPAALVGTAAGDVFAQLIRMRDDDSRRAQRDAIAKALAALSDARISAEASAAMRCLDAKSPLEAATLAAPYTLGRLFGATDDELPAIARAAVRFAARIAPGAKPDADESADAVQLLARTVRGGFLGPLLEGDVPNAVGLFSQAQDGTAGLVGNALVALARNPEYRSSDVRSFVERIASNDPAIQNTRRFVIRPITIAHTSLVPGDTILVVLAAAARRDPSLAFGAGRHACPGRRLALGIASAAVEFLRDRPFETRGYRESTNARIPV